VTPSDHAYYWGIDSISLNGKTLFIGGWFFSSYHHCSEVWLELISGNKELIESIALNAGNPRQDVALIHSHEQHALHSGFTGLGAWSSAPSSTAELRLRCVLADGSQQLLVIPEDRWRANHFKQSILASLKIRLAHFRHYGLKAAALVARGQLGVLRTKVVRQLSDQPSSQIPKADLLAEMVQPAEHIEVHLIVDHRLGGGANQYRERMIHQYLGQGDTVLILGFQITTLSLVLTVRRSDITKHFHVISDQELMTALSRIQLSDIVYNTAVSFANPQCIPELLSNLKRLNGGTLTLLLHDYFMICPSHFLLDKSGVYCGIPKPEVCQQCLPVNPHGFTSLFNGDILQWRKAWHSVIRDADKIIAFSKASASLLEQTFPDSIQAGVLQIQPHEVSYLQGQVISLNGTAPLVIGIVGQIGLHKGAEVVRDLAAEIRHQGGSERIAVIGTLEINADRAIISETGPYVHEDLAEEIRRSGANLMLLPSIWPETFSYVAQEMIELSLPLACFNWGAPAERIKAYPKGYLLSSRHPKEILEELRKFFRLHYSSASQPSL